MNINIFDHFGMDHNLGYLIKYRDYEIKSWCIDIPNIRDILSQLDLENSNIVEIGVHGGASLMLTFDIVEGKNCKITGIDCWEDIIEVGINGIDNSYWEKDSLDLFLKLHKENRIKLNKIINDYDKKNQIELIKGFSNDLKIINKFEDNSLDLIYIDGDHSFEGCYEDLKNWYPKLKVGGFILNDDYNWESVKKAVSKFCSEYNILSFKEVGSQSIIKKTPVN